jgi:hypothetical protein
MNVSAAEEKRGEVWEAGENTYTAPSGIEPGGARVQMMVSFLVKRTPPLACSMTMSFRDPKYLHLLQ